MTNTYHAYITFLILACICLTLNAQVSLPNQIQARFTKEIIQLDGKLNEAAWEQAMKIDNFTQRELNIGEPVTEQTEVAILYDRVYLYIGVWCYDSEPDRLTARELRRDFDYHIDDNFIIVIDTYHDKRNGFMFVTNPNAARTDLQVFNNGSSSNIFWNGVWDVQTTTTSEGWFAEFRIPFYTLKYRKDVTEQIWGINFERNIRRKREQALWQGWSRDNNIQQVNQAGTLIGLDRLENKQFVEVKPYVIGGGEFSGEDRNSVLDAGGDINYLLNPTYRLNLTFNTDFAQVEADQQQINITRFPLFFPELREFFLEGDDFFDFGFGGNRIVPFYTRRIGLNEERETVPIIAGARLLGKEQNSTVGLMSIQTAEKGEQPLTNYSVGSWRQDVGRQSVVGAMTVNKIADNRWHTTTGVNGRYRTSKLFGMRNFEVGGAFIHTYNTDEGFNKNAYAYRAFINYPNDKISFFASTQQSPAPFSPEVGLQRRQNFRENFAIVNLSPRPKGALRWIRQFEFRPVFITYTQYNDTGDLQTFDYGLQFLGFDTRSGERVRLTYRSRAEGLIRDFEIFQDIIIPSGTYWWQQWEAQVVTFEGRALAFESNFTFGDFYDGDAFRNQTDLLWRINKHVNVSLRYERNDVNLPEGSFDTDLIGGRLKYAINPNAFGSFLAQWNSAQDEMNLNFRLRIIPKIGTDFFLIINQIYDTEDEKFDAERGTILGKLIWRFVI